PMRLANFIFPYVTMDIPTPQPFHTDLTPPPGLGVRDRVMGAPKLSLDLNDVKVGFSPGNGSTVQTVQVANPGTGILAWYATPSEPWLIVQPYAGVGVGKDLPCSQGSPCDRTAHIQISVDAARASPGSR